MLGEGEGDFDGVGDGDGVGHTGEGDTGVAGAEADVFGEGEGDFLGEGDDVLEGEVEADGEAHVTRALVAVLEPGRNRGPGPWCAKNRASGTTTMPTTTVSTKVTAPHSRRTKAQFTRREV